jgi:hypothetical protein
LSSRTIVRSGVHARNVLKSISLPESADCGGRWKLGGTESTRCQLGNYVSLTHTINCFAFARRAQRPSNRHREHSPNESRNEIPCSERLRQLSPTEAAFLALLVSVHRPLTFETKREILFVLIGPSARFLDLLAHLSGLPSLGVAFRKGALLLCVRCSCEERPGHEAPCKETQKV